MLLSFVRREAEEKGRWNPHIYHDSVKADQFREILMFLWPFSYRFSVLMADIRSYFHELNSAADGNEYDPRNEENNRTYLN